MTPVNVIMIGKPVYSDAGFCLAWRYGLDDVALFVTITASESNIYLDRIELDYYYSVKDKNPPPSNSYLLVDLHDIIDYIDYGWARRWYGAKSSRER